jgi:hypothetical protein
MQNINLKTVLYTILQTYTKKMEFAIMGCIDPLQNEYEF